MRAYGGGQSGKGGKSGSGKTRSPKKLESVASRVANIARRNRENVGF